MFPVFEISIRLQFLLEKISLHHHNPISKLKKSTMTFCCHKPVLNTVKRLPCRLYYYGQDQQLRHLNITCARLLAHIFQALNCEFFIIKHSILLILTKAEVTEGQTTQNNNFPSINTNKIINNGNVQFWKYIIYFYPDVSRDRQTGYSHVFQPIRMQDFNSGWIISAITHAQYNIYVQTGFPLTMLF